MARAVKGKGTAAGLMTTANQLRRVLETAFEEGQRCSHSCCNRCGNRVPEPPRPNE